MPYLPPDIWVHGDRVSAERLNKLADSIVALYERSGGINLNIAVLRIGTNRNYVFVHTQRWLHFAGEGIIESTVNPATNFTEIGTDQWKAAFDLDTVPWLSYGALYRASGISWAVEEPDA